MGRARSLLVFGILSMVLLASLIVGYANQADEPLDSRPSAAPAPTTARASTPVPTAVPTVAPTKAPTAAPTAIPVAPSTTAPAKAPAAVFKTLPTSPPVTFREYAEYMAKQHAKLAVALQTVSTLSKQGADNPRLVTERGKWLVDMSYALSDVEIAANNIQKAGTVPPELEPLDDKAKSIGRDLENAASKYWDGFDKVDPALIKSASVVFQDVGPRLKEYNEDLKAFMEAHQ